MPIFAPNWIFSRFTTWIFGRAVYIYWHFVSFIELKYLHMISQYLVLDLNLVSILCSNSYSIIIYILQIIDVKPYENMSVFARSSCNKFV